jgi:cytochrome oxidase Cu insertion factor (SCO1/SenC/PrrC family)
VSKKSFAFLQALAVLILPALPAAAQTAAKPAQETVAPSIPDVELTDQDGRPVHVYSDLIRGRRVAMNFVFTTCTTICPPMGANFERLQKVLGARAGRSGNDVRLISVSIDPQTDTPQRLKEWGAKFHAGPGWTLLTGRKEEVDRLLKALGVYTPDRADHSPLVLLGNEPAKRWTRAYGLAAPAKMVELLDGLGPAPAAAAAAGVKPPPRPAAAGTAAHNYFTDVELIDQDGKPHRLYSDLLADRTVVVDVFFSECTGSCPMVGAALAKLQGELGERMGRDIYLLSISVDPANDTPARLKEYAARFKAGPGWFFLTGKPENVELALRKLGQYVEKRDAHSNILLVGNEKTGLWKKIFGLNKPEEILTSVRGVLDDPGVVTQGF